VQLGNSFVIGGKQEKMSDAELIRDIKNLAQQREALLIEVKNLDDSLEGLRSEKNTILEKAQAEAERILAKANADATSILANADEHIAAIAEAGRQQAFDQGMAEGHLQIESVMIEKIFAVDALVEASFKAKREILVSGEKEILEMVVLIAEKVTKIEFDKNKEILSNIVKDALLSLKEREEVKILVNPMLANNLYAISEELSNEIKGINQIKIVEDSTISADGVIVESVESRVDARLNVQIAEISKKLFEEHDNKPVLAELSTEVESELGLCVTVKKTRKKKDV
jgi:flagellar assembly protein FliH